MVLMVEVVLLSAGSNLCMKYLAMINRVTCLINSHASRSPWLSQYRINQRRVTLMLCLTVPVV